MKVNRKNLLDSLRASTAFGFNATPEIPLDLAAVLFATALWESGGETRNVQDGGESLGLLSINQPTWASVAGDFDMERADDLDYQWSYAAPVVRAALVDVREAVQLLDARVARGEDGIVFDPLTGLSVWFSISWQYGQGHLSRWLLDESAKDFSSAGWAAFRARHGLEIQPDNDKRQRFYAETYLASLRDPAALLALLRERSESTRADWYTLALRALKVGRAAVESWLGVVRTGIKQPFVWFGHAAGTSLATFLLIGGAAFFLLTHQTPQGRQLHPKVQSHALEMLGGALLASRFLL